MKSLFKLLLTSTVILLVSLRVASIPAPDVVSIDEVRAKLARSFKAVSEAERMGGNVSSLVSELNAAIALLEEGESSGNETLIREASMRADHVLAEAPEAGREGTAGAQLRIYQKVAILSSLAILAFVVWIFGPRLFWSLWTRSKRDWRVKAC